MDKKEDKSILCPRMTSICRDIFKNSDVAAAAIPVMGDDDSSLNVIVALTAGLVGVVIILFSFLKKEQSRQREIKFNPVYSSIS